MRWAVCAVLAAGLAAACTKTFRGTAAQPNPLLSPTETLRRSERITIVTGDMELNLPRGVTVWKGDEVQRSRRYPLQNTAAFTVVSRDRLRFHVQIEHKWQEWTDLETWKVTLTDDQGRRYEPEAVERTRSEHIPMMWDYETRTAVRNRFGDVVHIADDGWKRRNALGSVSVFRGNGDFVFYSRNIFTPKIKTLTLVLERTSTAFWFTWNFADEPATTGPRASAGKSTQHAARR